MSSFRRMFTLALLATWWLATMHCRLEASSVSGELFTCAADAQDAGTDPHGCDRDACNVVEDGNYRPSPANVQIAAPTLVPDDDFGRMDALGLALTFASTASAQPAFPASAGLERPRDWVPGWHFARRDAPLSRAPSTVIA